jgi:type IV secretion system protein VirB10
VDENVRRRDRDGLTGREAILAEIERAEDQLAAIRAQGGDTRAYEARLQDLRQAMEAAEAGTAISLDYSGRNDLSRANQFAGAGAGRWKNPGKVEAPTTLLTLRTGSVIPAVMISGINSDLPGQIIGQVSQDVYDTPSGRHLLIPQGSRLVGEYSSQVAYGQSRVFAVWQRIVFPDGKALDIGNMTASTGAGYAGLKDRVNNHYLRIFGSAIMMSAILAGVEMTQNNRDDNGNQQRMADAMSESLGQVFGGAIAEMMQRNLSIAPTLEIRPGFRLNVMLLKDLVFERTYRDFDYAAAGSARKGKK